MNISSINNSAMYYYMAARAGERNILLYLRTYISENTSPNRSSNMRRLLWNIMCLKMADELNIKNQAVIDREVSLLMGGGADSVAHPNYVDFFDTYIATITHH